MNILQLCSLQPRCGNNLKVHRWMNKENVVYTYNGILFSLKKEGNPAICDNMDEL